MGKQFNDSEVFINEEVEFSIGAGTTQGIAKQLSTF